MKIRFTPEIAIRLETITAMTGPREFSGFGFVRWDKENREFIVDEFELGDIGNGGFTELPKEYVRRMAYHPERQRMRIWIHKHPVGNGNPGRHNWSGTDEDTCRNAPLGAPYGMAESVGWALAAVRTPRGWVGRLDTYGDDGKTTHLEVVPSLAQKLYPEVKRIFENSAIANPQHEYEEKFDQYTDDDEEEDTVMSWLFGIFS